MWKSDGGGGGEGWMKRGAMGAAAGASSARFLLSSPPRSLLPLSVGCYQDLTRRESEGVWRLSRPSPSPTDPPRSGPSVTQTDAARRAAAATD